MGMKIELCVYSGYKIYPGHGRSLVKVDGKNLRFLSGRTHKAHLLKRNPREVTWTVLYRRKHKKGLEEDVAKKRNKRTQFPESRRWSHPPGYHGQEEPEARGQEGPERAGRQSCQGAEEAVRSQEGSICC